MRKINVNTDNNNAVMHVNNDETAANYRAINRLSYSALAEYDKNRISFYKKYILKEKEQETSNDLRMGSLVDTLKTDIENFDKEFLVCLAPKPTAQLLRFIELVYSTRNDYETFSPVLEFAYETLKTENGGKIRDGLAKFIERFNTVDVKAYYEELLQAGSKTVITADEHILALKIVDSINNCVAFQNISEVIYKFPILFTYNGKEMKSEIDELDIDHNNKIIYIYDYKCTNFVESFLWDCFIKRKYYIQSGLYKYAVMTWANEHYKGYKVENLAFKVVDAINFYTPLLYKTTDAHFQQSFNGFYIGNRYCKGIDQLIAEIDLATEANNWGMSIENQQNNGIVYLPQFKNEKDN